MVCVCGHDITIWNCGIPVLGELNLKESMKHEDCFKLEHSV